MLKLYNNCTCAHLNGNNLYRFYFSIQYNGICLFVSLVTPWTPRDGVMENARIETATATGVLITNPFPNE